MGAGLVEDGEKLSTAAANAEYKQALVKSKEAAQQMQVIGSAYSTVADASPEQFKALLDQMSPEQKQAITKSIPKFFEETDTKLQKSQLERLMLTGNQQIMQQKLATDAQIHKDRNAALIKAAEIRVNGMLLAKSMGGSASSKEDMVALKVFDMADRTIENKYKTRVNKAETNLAALEEEIAVSKAKSWFGTPDKTLVAKLNAASAVVKDLDDQIIADKIKAAKMLPPGKERTAILNLLTSVETPTEEEASTDKLAADKAKPNAVPSPATGAPTAGGKPASDATSNKDSVSGLVEKGNIDLTKRPVVKNKDGSISTVRSMSFEEDGKEVLIPTVVGDKVVSDKEAVAYYRKTGEHLGKFDSSKAADAYAKTLHEQQDKMYTGTKSATAAGNKLTAEQTATVSKAEAAIKAGADPVKVKARLKQAGIPGY
jgi:hypothetical protein